MPTEVVARVPTSGATGRLATWLAETEPAEVPVAVRERAKRVLLDGVGCALVGARMRWSDTATDAVRAIGVLTALLAQPVAPVPGMEGRP